MTFIQINYFSYADFSRKKYNSLRRNSFSSGPFQMVQNPPGEGNGFPLLYSLLENSADKSSLVG